MVEEKPSLVVMYMHIILYTYLYLKIPLELNYIQWTSCGFSKYDIPVHVQDDVQVHNKLGILLLLVTAICS